MMMGSSLLAAVPGLRHAFFTSEGGVSDGIYKSLNGGLGSHDDAANVASQTKTTNSFAELAQSLKRFDSEVAANDENVRVRGVFRISSHSHLVFHNAINATSPDGSIEALEQPGRR